MAGISTEGGNSPVAGERVLELVGLEPTTTVLWNAGVSDQLTLSDTRHSSSKRAAIDAHFYKREISGCRLYRFSCVIERGSSIPGASRPPQHAAPEDPGTINCSTSRLTRSARSESAP